MEMAAPRAAGKENRMGRIARCAFAVGIVSHVCGLFIYDSFPFLYFFSALSLSVGYYVRLQMKGYQPLRQPAFYGMVLILSLPVIGPLAGLQKIWAMPRSGDVMDRQKKRLTTLITLGLFAVFIIVIVLMIPSLTAEIWRVRLLLAALVVAVIAVVLAIRKARRIEKKGEKTLLSLVIFSLTFLVVLPCQAGLRPVPLDVVMADGELFFVLEEPKEIEGVYVALHLKPLETIAEAKKTANKRQLTMWAAEYMVKPGDKKNYPKLAQIRYAGKTPGLETTSGPFELLKNVPYQVRIEIYGREFASEIFFVNDDNKAVMPDPTFGSRQGSAYAVSVDNEGNKILVHEPGLEP